MRVVNAVGMLGVPDAEAEDAVQEALVRAWVEDARHPIERLDAWVAVAAWNSTRSGVRRLGAERRAMTRLGAPSVEGNIDDLDTAIDVRRALAELPRRTREVAVLRYVLQLSTRETAAVLRVAEGTVKRTLADARTALARQLAMSDEEVNDR